MKPGYKTTEFWLTIVANVLVQAGALDVPDKYKWAVTAVTLVGYALSRGIAKGAERRPSVSITGTTYTPPTPSLTPVPPGRQATP